MVFISRFSLSAEASHGELFPHFSSRLRTSTDILSINQSIIAKTCHVYKAQGPYSQNLMMMRGGEGGDGGKGVTEVHILYPKKS